jgi:hypothetical protein
MRAHGVATVRAKSMPAISSSIPELLPSREDEWNILKIRSQPLVSRRDREKIG